MHGELPTKQEYEAWEHQITFHTFVHENVKGFMEGFRYDAHPMGMLLASVGALSTFYPESRNIHDAAMRQMQIVRLIAKMPTLGAWAFRHAQGKPYVYPDNDLGYAANFLSMLFKMSEQKFEADERLVQALEVLFILHADHEQNCSTNAVRSVGSSQVDPYSAVAAGIGALFGPLHGGANEAVLKMLRRIGSLDKVPEFIEGVKSGKERLMGFGHRVYKNYDPRATIIKKACDDVFEVVGVNPLLKIAVELEKIALEDEYFVSAQALPQRRLLQRPDLRGAQLPAGDVHRAVRHPAYLGLAGAVARDGRGPRAEDRPPQADLHRRPHPRLRAGLGALGLSHASGPGDVRRRLDARAGRQVPRHNAASRCSRIRLARVGGAQRSSRGCLTLRPGHGRRSPTRGSGDFDIERSTQDGRAPRPGRGHRRRHASGHVLPARSVDSPRRSRPSVNGRERRATSTTLPRHRSRLPATGQRDVNVDPTARADVEPTETTATT